MKTFNIKNQIINKNIEDVFNLMYNSNNNIVSSSVSQIIDWQTEDWHIRKTYLQKKDTITLYIQNLPDMFTSFLDNSNKHVKILMVSKIAFHNKKEYILRTKYKVINLQPIMQTVINSLHLVKTKCKIHLERISETSTKLNVYSRISVFLPFASEIETYIQGFIAGVFGKLNNTLFNINNNTGYYSYDDSKYSLVLEPSKIAQMADTNWSLYDNLSLSFWLKTNNLTNGDKILDFNCIIQIIRTFYDNTTDMRAWYKFEDNLNNFITTSYYLTSYNTAVLDATDAKRGLKSLKMPSTSYVENNAFAINNGDFSISFWYKTSTANKRLISFWKADDTYNGVNVDELFRTTPPYARYSADNWENNKFIDSSGNGRDSVSITGTVSKTSASGNGASTTISLVQGDSTSKIVFPTASIPSNFTICSISRYNATYNTPVNPTGTYAFPRYAFSGATASYITYNNAVVNLKCRTSSTIISSLGAYNIFDKKLNTNWLSVTNYDNYGVPLLSISNNYFNADTTSYGEYFIIDLGEAVIAQSCKIYSLNNAANTWRLYATNDDAAYNNTKSSSWIFLNGQSGITGWQANTYKTYAVTTDTAYRYYGIVITKTTGNQVAIYEFEILAIYPQDPNKRKVLTSTDGVFTHGHNRINTNGRGLVNYNGFKTVQTGYGTSTNWLVCCGRNNTVNTTGFTTAGSVIIDNTNVGIALGGTAGNSILSVNGSTGDFSDYQLADILIWNTHLNDANMMAVSQLLSARLASNKNINEIGVPLFELRQKNNNLIFLKNNREYITSTGIGTNTWRHITITHQSTGDTSIYIDGIKTSSIASSTLNLNRASVARMRIGENNNSEDTYIDDYRIYNRVITEQEINDLVIYTTSMTNNISIKKINNGLSFQANNTEIYNTPFQNNVWTNILWNITSSTSTNGLIKLSSESTNVEKVYTEIIPLSGTYTNILGSAQNIGIINISDFSILA